MASPTARTLTLLRRLGFIADVVERWLPHVDRRHDLFHFGDVLAAHPRDRVILIVQCTTRQHLGDRLKAGGAFEVWGWAQRGGQWIVKRVAVEADSLQPVLLQVPPRKRREAQQGLLFEGGDTDAR
jgi:hypothetical protein